MEKIIEILKYILLGITQGISEVLPISSSAHLKILQAIMGLDTSSLTLEIFLHFASLLAVIIYFKSDLIDLSKSGVSYLFKKKEENKKDGHLLYLIIIATIPAGICGVFFADLIEDIFSRLIYVGATLILTSFIVYSINIERKEKKIDNLNVKDALFIGISQAFGIAPGISRSGITIAAGRRRGLSKSEASKISFLLFIPIAFGSGVLSITRLVNIGSDFIALYAISGVLAFIFTLTSLKWLKVLVQKRFRLFPLYTFILGSVVIIFDILT